ncbi:MAG: histidine phosphatase family protein [Planctomycetota bacterium]
MNPEPALTLFLIRHGDVSPQPPGAFYGGAEIPLSPQGREEARQAARKLQGVAFDRILSSPLSRAHFGASCLLEGRPGLKLELEPRLREIDRGRWVGLTPQQIETAFPGDLAAHKRDPAEWRDHGGESLGDLQSRVLEVLEDLERNPFPGVVAMVSHLWPIRAVLARAQGVPLEMEAWNTLKVPTGSIHQIRL